MQRLCVVQLDALVDLPVDVLTRRLGRLSDEAMRRVCAGLAVAAACA